MKQIGPHDRFIPDKAWREYIRDELRAKGITYFDFAYELYRSTAWVSNLINGHVKIDLSMERAIEHAIQSMAPLKVRFDLITARKLKREFRAKGYSIREIGDMVGISEARLGAMLQGDCRMDPKEMESIKRTIENIRRKP